MSRPTANAVLEGKVQGVVVQAKIEIGDEAIGDWRFLSNSSQCKAPPQEFCAASDKLI